MLLTRTIALTILSLLVVAACQAVPTDMFEADGEPSGEPDPTAITKTLCESGADLRTDIEFLRGIEVSEDGLLQLIVAIDAALGEARTLAALAGAEYGPLVADVVVSLQDLRDIADELEGQDTIGAGLTAVGKAITQVGQAMDRLELRLREPCPED